MQNHAFIKKNSQNSQFATLVAENQYKSNLGKSLVLVVAALALAFACLCFAPQQAYAKSYEMPHTTINATVQSNGDLHVVEQRMFDFSGAFTAVWWNFDNLPSGSDIKINSVSMGSSAKSLSEFSSVPFIGVNLVALVAMLTRSTSPRTPSMYSFRWKTKWTLCSWTIR